MAFFCILKPSFYEIFISEEAILCEDRTTEDERRSKLNA